VSVHRTRIFYPPLTSCSNAVELIVAIIALAKHQIVIVQTSLIGSMLSNLLIVMGMCFFFGGLNRIEQFFNVTVAQTASSLLALSVGSLIIPTGFTWNGVIDPATTNIDERLSRGTAIILLIVYGAYLFFQLKSHKDLYNEESAKAPKRRQSRKEEGATFKALAGIGGRAAASSGGGGQQHSVVQVPDDEPEEPTLSLVGSIVTLCGATALIGVNAEFLVDSINVVTCKYNVSEYFVGLVLLPIVGNAAEHATAVTVAIKDKMDLAIGVAVGSSMQIALFVLPLTVIIGWIIGADMTLVFDNFQIGVLFVAIILVNYLIGDGKSHWLEGTLLMALYLIIAVAAWFYPLKAPGQCST
jgi:Ca2+:H+ antiporter